MSKLPPIHSQLYVNLSAAAKLYMKMSAFLPRSTRSSRSIDSSPPPENHGITHYSTNNGDEWTWTQLRGGRTSSVICFRAGLVWAIWAYEITTWRESAYEDRRVLWHKRASWCCIRSCCDEERAVVQLDSTDFHQYHQYHQYHLLW